MGVYHARTFGPAGRRIQVILLDTRYFRGALERSTARGVPGDGRPVRYSPSHDPMSSMLGDAQWAWLEERLREPAELRLVVSSIQVVAEDHGFEGWSRLPLERERLLALVDETGAEGVLFLSGDRHLAELSILDPERSAEMADTIQSHLGFPFWARDWKEMNRNFFVALRLQKTVMFPDK